MSTGRLYIIFIVCMLLPLMQYIFSFTVESNLNGASENINRPIFSFHGWSDQSYQLQMGEHMDQSIGFATWMVRAVNQLRYSIFRETSNPTILVGHQDYLYEKIQLDAIAGNDYPGHVVFERTMNQLAAFSQDMKNKGKKFIFVLCPNKADVYPEYIPFKVGNGPNRNYDKMVSFCKHHQIDLIDFNAFFKEYRFKSPHPLHTNTGVHWSFYGESIFVDSLSRYIDRQQRGTGIRIDFSNIETSMDARYTDNDLEKLLNLYMPISSHSKAYPALTYNKEGKKPVSAIIIADSYYSNLYFNTSFHTDYFAEGSTYWYYCTTQHPGNSTLTEDQIRFAIEEKEYVIIMLADYTFPYILPKTAEQLHNATFGYDADSFEEKVQAKIKEIKNTPVWYQQVAKKAMQRSISIDSMIREDAEWAARH